MNTPIKSIKVKDRKTGEIKIAFYCANRLGNMRMAIDGKYYSDKEFIKKYTQVIENN